MRPLTLACLPDSLLVTDSRIGRRVQDSQYYFLSVPDYDACPLNINQNQHYEPWSPISILWATKIPFCNLQSVSLPCRDTYSFDF